MALPQQLDRCPKYQKSERPCDDHIWEQIQRRYDARGVFLNVPFVPEYLELGTSLAVALTCLNFRPITARDERRSSEPRLCKICELMQTCRYCVTDLTEWRPNVAMELGMALSLGCKTVVFASERHEAIKELSDYAVFEVNDHKGDWKAMVRKVVE